MKPENILYSSQEDNATLKIADFGLACLLKPNQLMNVACGTPGYVAPEILRGQQYGKEVDMWSIGVILYILLCGFPPFYDDNNKKLFALIINANYSFPDPYWSNVSASAKELIQSLLVVDPTKRLTATQCLEHAWLKEEGGSNISLDYFKPNMISYNARRRFRAAIRAVQIAKMFKGLGESASEKRTPSIMDIVDDKDPLASEKAGAVAVTPAATESAAAAATTIPVTTPAANPETTPAATAEK